LPSEEYFFTSKPKRNSFWIKACLTRTNKTTFFPSDGHFTNWLEIENFIESFLLRFLFAISSWIKAKKGVALHRKYQLFCSICSLNERFDSVIWFLKKMRQLFDIINQKKHWIRFGWESFLFVWASSIQVIITYGI